ncbi:response regulator transcription factor [Gulosibacter sp. 10]|uniref:response regulator n=1 Tax=Gulosibacter sp. 10 TaxID=1255570 RepID=UPI00097F1385|nr:response regulator transcription factor [Gulosibacter sp. 10]SJM70193.1 DNA-binding response regulator, LuxR family [Gulosibacter sp. 10]
MTGEAMAGAPGAADGIRVLIVDDQPLLRHSLRVLVEGAEGMVVAAQAATGREAVRAAREALPDVVLMDIRMPDGDGIAATAEIAADPALAGCRVLVLTMFELDEYVYGALRAGASGFLLKDASPAQFVDAIRRTAAGESLFAPSVLARLVGHYVESPPAASPRAVPDALTPRESEVLALIGAGLSNQELASALTISIKTVKTHVGSLLAKLHARDRAQLVIAAYRYGLVGRG